MKKLKKYNIELLSDSEGNSIGLTIGITESVEIDGEILSKPTLTNSFRKKVYKESQVLLPKNVEKELVENPNFEKQVDDFTGEKDFIKNKVNF